MFIYEIMRRVKIFIIRNPIINKLVWLVLLGYLYFSPLIYI